MATPDSTTPSPVRLLLQTDFDSPLPTRLLRELTESALVVIEYAAMALRGVRTVGQGAMALAMIRQLDADLDGALRIELNQYLDGSADPSEEFGGVPVTVTDRAAEVVILVDRARARSRELAGVVAGAHPAARALVTGIVGDVDRARAFARELAANLAVARQQGESNALVSAPAYATSLNLLLIRARAETEKLAYLIGDSSLVVDLSYREHVLSVLVDVEYLATSRPDARTIEASTAVLKTLFGSRRYDSHDDVQRRVEESTQLPAPQPGPACWHALQVTASYAWSITSVQ